jgi:peptidylprolyl isomerase
MPVKNGDFVLIDYVMRVKETGELSDTTVEDAARQDGTYKEDAVYEPMLVVVGEGWVLKGLDDALVGLTVGQEAQVELPPDQHVGPRDPGKIRMVPMRRLRKQNITPYPGAQIEIEGRAAVIRAVGAGRVQVDFNPPLAGKTLVYDLTVKTVLRGRPTKAHALLHRRIPVVPVDKFATTFRGARATIEVPEEARYIEGLAFAKRGIAADFHRFFPKIATVLFTEPFQRAPPTLRPAEASQDAENG